MRTVFDNVATRDLEEIKEEIAEYNEESIEDISDNRAYDYENENIQLWFDDEKSNLSVFLDEDIIAIADLGFWNGRRSGYKLLGNNLNEIFNIWESCDYIKLYGEKGNIHGRGYHHDGTHKITFRKWNKDITDNQKELVQNALYNGEDIDKYVKRYTRSIYSDVAKVYGW